MRQRFYPGGALGVRLPARVFRRVGFKLLGLVGETGSSVRVLSIPMVSSAL